MARAFGATAGAASTDIISLPCANGLASTRTISFHGFRNGTGDNDLGRYFDRQGATLCYLDSGSAALWFEDALTPTGGAYFLSLRLMRRGRSSQSSTQLAQYLRSITTVSLSQLLFPRPRLARRLVPQHRSTSETGHLPVQTGPLAVRWRSSASGTVCLTRMR
jgi:hypothetical protein